MWSNATTSFNDKIQEYSRTFKARLVLADASTVEISTLTYTNGITGADTFTLGGAVSSMITGTIVGDFGKSLKGQEVTLQIGLEVTPEQFEYITMGIYKITSSPALDGGGVSFTAYDAMYYKYSTAYTPTSGLGETITETSTDEEGNEVVTTTTLATIGQVLADIETQLGISINNSCNTALMTSKVKVLGGYYIAETLGYLASALGGFVYVDRSGIVTIAPLGSRGSFQIDGDRYYNLTKGEENTVIDGVIVSTGGNDYHYGRGASIALSNPILLEASAEAMANAIIGTEYRPVTVSFLGDVRLDSNDTLTIISPSGENYTTPIMQITHTFDGGITTTVTSLEVNEVESEVGFTGSVTQQLERTQTELLDTKTLVAQKADIKELNVVKGTIEELDAKITRTGELVADKATIGELNVVKADITELNTNLIKTNELVANKASIAELEATKANIKVLEADSAKINSLIFGNAVGGTISADFATAIVGKFQNGIIKSAMIESLAVDKVQGGTISTKKFRVASDDGNLAIADNTIQIKDGTRVRIQIGKDSTGDYNLSLWDATGKKLWDAKGITSDAIRDGLIDNDMINDNANIGGDKLNLPSLVKEINDSTETIKASHILYDPTKQTLDIAFQSMSQEVGDLSGNVSTLQTNHSVMNGQIKTVISATETLDRELGTVADDVATAMSKADTAKNTATSALTKATSVETSLNGFKTQVSETYTTKTDFNNLQIGGRNLLVGAGKYTKDSPLRHRVDNMGDDAYKIYESELSVYLENGKTYTISFETNKTPASHGGDERHVSFWIWKESPNYFRLITDDSGKKEYTITWDMPTDTYTIRLNNYKAGAESLWWNMQIEEGNKRTSWNVPSEDLQTNIDNIQVGGRNLVRGSDNLKVIDHSDTVTTTNNTDGSFTTTSGDEGWVCFSPQIGLHQSLIENAFNEGEQFTISIDIKSNDSTKIPKIFIKLGMGYYPLTGKMGLEYSRFYYTGTWKKANEISLHVTTEGITGTFTFRNLQIEKGNKATDWSPAPEDVNASIATVDGKFTNYTTTTELNSKLTQTKNEISTEVSGTYTTKAEYTTGIADVNKKFGSYTTTADLNTKLTQTKEQITLEASETYTTKTDFNNLQIGGRNLLVGAGKYTKDSPLRHCVTNMGDDAYKIYDEFSVYLENGKTYTISFETDKIPAGHGGDERHVSFWIWKESPNYFRLITDDSGKKEYTITWDMPTDTYTIRLNNYKAGAESLWWNMQIEEGNKRTSWSVPVEDTESTISTLRSSITANANAINLKVSKGDIISSINQTAESVKINASKIDLQGYVTVSALSGSGTTTINGANIKTGAIQSSNYVANSAGTKINLSDGTIDTKGFKVNSAGVATLTGATLTNVDLKFTSNGEDVGRIYSYAGGGGFPTLSISGQYGLDLSSSRSVKISGGNVSITADTNISSLTVGGKAVQLCQYANGYDGLLSGTSDTNWIRTTKNGIIPYQSGNYSALGTSSWRFNQGWFNELNTNKINVNGTIQSTGGDVRVKNGDNTARLGKGDNDVFVHNSVSGKYLQLKDNGSLQYSGTDIILASHFTGTKNTNGYIKLPNGLILQWGSLNMTCTSGGTTVSSTVTFPVKFSSACYQIVTAVASGVPHICSTSASDYSTSNFKYHLNRTNTTQTSCRWIAIGS